MKNFIYPLFVLFFLSNNTKAQTFLNGSFEPQGTNMYICAYNTTTNYDQNMGYSWAIGSLGTIFVGGDSCGLAADGHNYVGLKATGSGYNGVVLKLSSPLKAGGSYVINFYAKKTDTGNAVKVRIGISNDSLSVVDTLNSLSAPLNSSWTLRYDSIVSPVAAQYITVQAVKDTVAADTAMTYIDNFTLINTTAVPELSAANNIQLYPNPFSNETKLVVNNNIAFPYQIAIYDITGKLIMQQQQLYKNELTLSRNGLSKGIYFLKVIDANKNNFYMKLIAE